MRRLVTAALVAMATLVASYTPARSQCDAEVCAVERIAPPTATKTITPLGIYAIASIGCMAVAPMAQSALIGRELTLNEAYRTMFGCVAGPLGWLLADLLAPPTVAAPGQPPPPPPRQRGAQQAHGRNISIPPAGATSFVNDEILLELAAGTPQSYRDRMAAALRLTLLETQTFALTGRSLERWRIDGNGTVRGTLRRLPRYTRVLAAQVNSLYRFSQDQSASAPAADSAQYVVPKLHLLEAHRVSNGDDVLVAVIDSKIDAKHPDLAGVIAGEYDALGGAAAPAHAHGTGMAGAIAAHAKLLGVAPKAKLLAVRAFGGSGDSAQGTTFNIMKGIDWAAARGARIVNMSFAGPPDVMLRDMLAKAHARGIVLIAAVGNAGPRSPPLYPAADRDVIGVTATDADDRLLPQANRGTQVAVAAPGVQVLVPAPDASYEMTTGTSVAAAEATGVAALLLARNRNLSPADVRRLLVASARKVPGPRRDVGAGVIDALAAVDAVKNY